MTASLPEGSRGLPRLWLIDTSSLVTMAAHGALRTAVVDYLAEESAAVAMAVVHELQRLRSVPPPTAQWSNRALTQISWLGDPVPVTQGPVLDVALDIQEDMAAEAPLERDDQHWGESVIISLAMHLTRFDAVMLSEDYNARVGAHRRGIASMSLAKLARHMVLDSFRTPGQAEGYTRTLVRARRWTKQPIIAAEDFTDGRLGRMGRP